jgi:hypothetical protein
VLKVNGEKGGVPCCMNCLEGICFVRRHYFAPKLSRLDFLEDIEGDEVGIYFVQANPDLQSF